MSSLIDDIYNKVYDHVVVMLHKELSPDLTYHSIDHTLDVLARAQQIAAMEGITNEKDLLLLKIAALYHDTGFLFTYAGHEEKGCELAKEELPRLGLTNDEVDTVCGMIMATKIPQSPSNILEEIICDADLDYLGRGDFETISNNLYKEFLAVGIVKDHAGWMQKQINFFESHHYFTKSVQELRNTKKMIHLTALRSLLH